MGGPTSLNFTFDPCPQFTKLQSYDVKLTGSGKIETMRGDIEVYFTPSRTRTFLGFFSLNDAGLGPVDYSFTLGGVWKVFGHIGRQLNVLFLFATALGND